MGAPYFNMPKETYYFAHDYEPTADPKIQALIQEYGWEGYGLFWRITEMLHSDHSHKLPKKNYIFSSLKTKSTNAEQVATIVESCITEFELFESDGSFIWSNRVDRNIIKRQSLSSSRSDAGKASALKRQQNKEISTSVEQVLTGVEQNPTKERKGKENKEKEIKVNDIVDRELKFSQTLKPYIEKYGKDFIDEFYGYWSEPNKSGTKFRQEGENFWDLAKRLNTWDKNKKKFTGKLNPVHITEELKWKTPKTNE